MAKAPRSTSIDDKLEQLRNVIRLGDLRAIETVLRDALKQSNWLLASQAAEQVAKLSLHELAPDLLNVWPRFCDGGVKRDPGCRAKEAMLTALDQLEWPNPAPFLLAVRYRQYEPGLGGKVNTAGGTRLRAQLALFRLLHDQAPLFAGELMADANPHVRAGVARAIGHYEDRASVGLLTYKLAAGDEEPAVLLECAGSLLKVDADFGLAVMLVQLAANDEARRETAALALAQCCDERAQRALCDWLEHGAAGHDHELGIRALGLSRSQLARQHLLTLVQQGTMAHARAAIESLSVHRYDAQLVERVLQCVADRSSRELEQFARRILQSSHEDG